MWIVFSRARIGIWICRLDAFRFALELFDVAGFYAVRGDMLVITCNLAFRDHTL